MNIAYIAAVNLHILVDIFMYLDRKQMNIGYLLSSSVIMFHVCLVLKRP